LYEVLSEYYQAAGQTQKGIDLIAKLIEIRPDDVELRNRFAQDLYRRQKFAEACEQYKIILKKQPQVISRRYFEVTQAFQRAGREPELAEVLIGIDLKQLGQPYMVTQLFSSMMRPGQAKVAAMALFKKAWEAFPPERMRLMTYAGDEIW